MSSLDTLIQKLAGANSSVSAAEPIVEEATVLSDSLTDPVFVEKLASAVDFIVDQYPNQQEEPQTQVSETAAPVASEVTEETPVVENVSQISDLMRERLQAQLAKKTETETVEEDQQASQVAQNVLGRLLALRSGSSEEETEVEEKPETASVEPLEEAFETSPYSNDEPEVSNEASSEEEVKAASVDQSLADVLNAALSSDEQVQESVPDEDAKTAGVRGGNGPKARKQGVEVLKEKLLATVGKEAQS